MRKAVLISIRPEWCQKIMAGRKTIEVRKTRPKMDTPFRGYIYRTKGTVPHIINGKWVQMEVGGTIIAEFTCDRIYELEMRSPGGSYYVKGEDQPTTNDVARHSCLTLWDMHEYLQAGKGYGWHISNLRIYDHPRDLWEFTGLRETKFGAEPVPITRPPQSWRYVEEELWND